MKKIKRGRPIGSLVRNRIIKIIKNKDKPIYGYEVFSEYKKKYPNASIRLIYYHLKKAFLLGEIKIAKISKEKGKYSWGNEVERTYYEVK